MLFKPSIESASCNVGTTNVRLKAEKYSCVHYSPTVCALNLLSTHSIPLAVGAAASFLPLSMCNQPKNRRHQYWQAVLVNPILRDPKAHLSLLPVPVVESWGPLRWYRHTTSVELQKHT